MMPGDITDHGRDHEGSFQFSTEAEFISPLYVHTTLATDIETESLCFARLPQC